MILTLLRAMIGIAEMKVLYDGAKKLPKPKRRAKYKPKGVLAFKLDRR